MTSRGWFSPIIVVTAALAAGCAPSIRSERDDNIPIPQGATWAWANVASAAQDTGAARRYIPRRYTSNEVDPIVQQRFRRAIESAMRAKGLRRAEDTAQADFVLGFSFEGTDAYRRPAVAPVVGFGYYGGGYRPWGFGAPWGFYRPWGYYGPWGGPWGWGLSFAAYPAYGYGAAMPYGGGEVLSGRMAGGDAAPAERRGNGLDRPLPWRGARPARPAAGESAGNRQPGVRDAALTGSPTSFPSSRPPAPRAGR